MRVILNNEHLMCLMHVQLKTEFLICHIWKLQCKKKAFIIMHDTTWIDHTWVMMWKFMNCFAPKMGYMACEQVVIHLFHNFMNMPHWIRWKTDELASSSPIPRCATYSVTSVPPICNCCSYIRMEYTFAYEMIRITKRCVTFNTCKKHNFHKRMKTTVTLKHAYVALSFSIAWNARIYIYKAKSVHKKRCSLR
jgi:hypothetical protein